MCGLIFTEETARWNELVTANMLRAGSNKGAFTFTPLTFENIGVTADETVEWADEVLSTDAPLSDMAGVTHLQAPTSSFSRPHPARILAAVPPVAVWHNGMLVESSIEKMRHAVSSTSGWDTELIAEAISYGFVSPEFAALWNQEGAWAVITVADGMLYAFRNPVAPLFTNGTSLSSVKTGDINQPLAPGHLYTYVRSGQDGPRQWVQTGLKYDCVFNPYGL